MNPEANTSPVTAIVTGSAVRIGRALAEELGRRGWQVVVHYRNSRVEAEETVEAIAAAGGRAIAVAADLMDPARAADTLFEAAENRLGPVTLFINNAAVFSGGTGRLCFKIACVS